MSVMIEKYASSSRLGAWVGKWLVKFAGDFDKGRKYSSAGQLLHFCGRDAYPAVNGVVRVGAPKDGADGIPAQMSRRWTKLPPAHVMKDSAHQGMNDLRVRHFTRKAGRECNISAQYAIGLSLLAQEAPAQVGAKMISLPRVH